MTVESQYATKLMGQSLIIASENPEFRAQLGRLFHQVGAEIIEADNGVDILETLDVCARRKRRICHIVTEISLPRMDGVAVLRSLRENPARAELPVIVFFRENEERKLQECRAWGITAAFPITACVEETALPLLTQVINCLEVSPQKTKEKIPDHPECTALDFPYEFKGLPQPKNYALRPAFFRCPFCETTFSAPRLVNRALKPDPQDYMGVGLYTEGMERDFLEYLLIECFCCPNCLYTADRSGFYSCQQAGQLTLADAEEIPLKEWRPIFFSVTSRLQDHLKTTLPERLELLKQATGEGQGMFELSLADKTIPRLPADALLSYDLARRCAEQVLPAQQRGEEQARLHHKISGYHVKQYYIYGMMRKNAAAKRDMEEMRRCQQQQGKSLLAALAAVNQVNDIEFNVIEECLYCQTRRFFIADLLCRSAGNEEQREKLANLRKRAFGAMKATMIRARQEKSNDIKTIERFMLPLENRMLEVEKEEENSSAKNVKKM